tara:strand:- start:856 stop:1848 length:993 start_codon:yes stop_codon:yes gene_type:complete
MENKKYYGLDLLRGIAGYGVAITHYLYFIKDKVNFEYYSFIFVEIFFVLSGFVLSNQLIKIHNEKNNLKVFYIRRLLRTIPLYVVALIFYTAISNNFNLDFFKFLIFIQKIIPNFVESNYFMVAWSLSIEEFFYFLFPIYLILYKKTSALRLVIYFIIFLMSVKILFYDNLSAEFLRTGTLLRLDSIALGFLLSIFFSRIINYKKIVFFLSFLLIIIFINFKSYFFNNESLNTLYFIFLAQFLSITLVISFCNLEIIINKSKLIKGLCSIIANQTYSVYLFHLIIMHFLIMSTSSYINNLFTYLLLLFIVSFITFKYFERPILSLRPKYK